MRTFAAVIDKFGIAEVAAILRLEESHVRTMKARDSIPPEYWGLLIDAGAGRGIRLTHQILRQMRAERFPPEKGRAA